MVLDHPRLRRNQRKGHTLEGGFRLAFREPAGSRILVRAPSGTRSASRPLGALELRPDLDAIEALSIERDTLWSRLQGVTFLTDGEEGGAAGDGASLDAADESPSSGLPPGAGDGEPPDATAPE